MSEAGTKLAARSSSPLLSLPRAAATASSAARAQYGKSAICVPSWATNNNTSSPGGGGGEGGGSGEGGGGGGGGGGSGGVGGGGNGGLRA